MAKRLTFTRYSLDDIADNKDAEAGLKRYHKLSKPGDIVPESVWLQANATLAERSRALSFSSHRTYVECMRETLHKFPHLRLGIGPYMYDREFPGITFVEEEIADDNDAS